MFFTLLSDWFATLSLIFGGCCSNAITLEQLTSEYPHAGSLITFFQFVIISLYGFPRHITWTRYGPRFRPRRIPLTPYVIQVALFYLISLLNNAAFAYHIPMSVHIIFRSGGLVISMVLGWIVLGKKYTMLQILSVLLVTLGVILTTLSASPPAKISTSIASTRGAYTYATGIGILTLALLLSGFLGLVQDRTYAKYGRPAPPGTTKESHKAFKRPGKTPKASSPPAWQESMFYLHFLALPMFISVRSDLLAQLAMVNAGPKVSLSSPVPSFLSTMLCAMPPSFSSFNVSDKSAATWFSPLISFSSGRNMSPSDPNSVVATLAIPEAYLPLLINTLTQLLCVAGVHRLTTRVSALTVTLVLVVRKAVSLMLSVVGVGLMNRQKANNVNIHMMWTGAFLVLLGTVGYTIGTGSSGKKDKKE